MAVVALASARARARARRMAIRALMPPADRFSVAHMEKVDFPAARISNSRRSSASVQGLFCFAGTISLPSLYRTGTQVMLPIFVPGVPYLAVSTGTVSSQDLETRSRMGCAPSPLLTT